MIWHDRLNSNIDKLNNNYIQHWQWHWQRQIQQKWQQQRQYNNNDNNNDNTTIMTTTTTYVIKTTPVPATTTMKMTTAALTHCRIYFVSTTFWKRKESEVLRDTFNLKVTLHSTDERNTHTYTPTYTPTYTHTSTLGKDMEFSAHYIHPTNILFISIYNSTSITERLLSR